MLLNQSRYKEEGKGRISPKPVTPPPVSILGLKISLFKVWVRKIPPKLTRAGGEERLRDFWIGYVNPPTTRSHHSSLNNITDLLSDGQGKGMIRLGSEKM